MSDPQSDPLAQTSHAVVLATGTEITTGQITDTNSGWLCGQLWQNSVEVIQIRTLPDDRAALISALDAVSRLAAVVVCTGGLGPTRDDLTAEAAAAALGVPLEEDAEALAGISAIFARWGYPMTEENHKQALLPRGAAVLPNDRGTAPGFAITLNGAQCFFLPGVPHEMRAMFAAAVVPRLPRSTPPIVRTLRVCGLPEAKVEARLRELNPPIPLTIGFQASPRDIAVKLRMPAETPAEAQEEALHRARAAIGPAVFGIDCGDLATVVLDVLRDRGQTLSVAESCTGGRLAAWLTAVPGASDVFQEGVVAYANAAKHARCGVPMELIAEHGAVSELVARALAEGMCRQTDLGIGVTGIAGPSGGSPDKPVGTVFIAAASRTETVGGGVRLRVTGGLFLARGATAALHLLWRYLILPIT